MLATWLTLMCLSLTCNGAAMHRHLSSVMRAVIQAVMRVNVACGIPLVRCWNSIGSNGRPASMNAGVMQMLDQIKVDRHPMSETARP